MADSSIPDGRSSPVEMEAPFEVATPSKTGINPQAVENVIYSDVGLILSTPGKYRSADIARLESMFSSNVSSKASHPRG